MCSSKWATNFGPSVLETEIKFSIPKVSNTCPPILGATIAVEIPFLAAYIAALDPAGPPPTTNTSNTFFDLTLQQFLKYLQRLFYQEFLQLFAYHC